MGKNVVLLPLSPPKTVSAKDGTNKTGTLFTLSLAKQLLINKDMPILGLVVKSFGTVEQPHSNPSKVERLLLEFKTILDTPSGCLL